MMVCMTFISELRACVEALAAVPELDVEPERLPEAIAGLTDDVLERVLGGTAEAQRCADLAAVIAAGVAAQRSSRERGHGGMAAVRGHKTPVALIQAITGGTAADARRAVQVGASLLEGAEAGAGAGAGGPGDSGGDGDGSGGAAPVVAEIARATPWHDPLRRARLRGTITSEQHDAIHRGMGEPPDADDEVEAAAAAEVWSIAAEQLIAEAGLVPVEELRRRARTVRDQLDPAGAELRFAARFEARAFRMWCDADGVWMASIVFDPEMAVWVRSMTDAALRPRRGGPRFTTADERETADDLVGDPRTNDQLAYDLLMDVLRSGAVADAADVFGARQPGVRVVVVKDSIGPRDAFGRMLATGHAEDGGDPLPGSVVDRQLCLTGSVDVTVDSFGNPLDVGREQRLFTTPQRKALAIRDGGCAWPGCCVPASYCEAHHCDHWHEELGRTDIGRGILLCRFHHLLLHNAGYKITRDGMGPFVLHRPPGHGDPITLRTKAAWSWAWDPPPAPDRARWRDVRAAS